MEISDLQSPAQILVALLLGVYLQPGGAKLREFFIGDLEVRVKALEAKQADQAKAN